MSLADWVQPSVTVVSSVPVLGQGGCAVLASAAHGVQDFIAGQGGDAARVLERAGVPERDLGARRVALDLGGYCAMMELAAQETGRDTFGLWFGQQFQPESLGLIGDLALASPTVGAALENLVRLFPYHQQATETRLRQEGPLLALEYRILDGQILNRRQDAELTLGMFANVLRRALGADWCPEEVHFEHPRPPELEDYHRAFGAEVYFGQRSNALVFRPPDLDRAMVGGDLARMTQLQDELTGLVGRAGPPGWLCRVKGEIRSHLPLGAPHIEEIAAALGTPRWTLQRRLQDEGVSFSQAVEAVRQDLARLYLAQAHIPVSEIAHLLGYSEISAFSRAVKRWSGASPAQIRSRMTGTG